MLSGAIIIIIIIIIINIIDPQQPNSFAVSHKWSAPPPPKNVWGAAASQPQLKNAAALPRWFFQPSFERNIAL